MSRPRAPRRIALLDAEGPGGRGTVPALLADFQDALVAYDRMSSPQGMADPPAFLTLSPSTTAGAASPALDAFIIGLPLTGEDDAERAAAAIEAARGLPLRAGALAYAACSLGADDRAVGSVRRLARACGDVGLRWGGALAVHGGEAAPWIMRAPRLGFWRRPWSEGIDWLIAAVRAGLTVAEAATAFGGAPAQLEEARSDLIIAHCAVPRPVLRLMAGSGTARTR